MPVIHTGLQQIGDIADGAVTAAKLGAAAVTKTKFGGGVIKSALITGGVAGTHTVTGIAAGDNLFGVYQLEINVGDIDTMTDRLSEFSITDTDEVTNTTTDTSGHQLLFFYEDLT